MSAEPHVIVIGSGPAGLMAAETLAAEGLAVTVYDRMPSSGRKFLMAGRGGLNLTHSEALEKFLTRYGAATARLEPSIRAFPPSALCDWAAGLGQETFVGSSGRVFPASLKTSPLLRAWLARLSGLGIEMRYRQEWLGWDATGAPMFRDAAGAVTAQKPDAVILALGGGSWPRLGSNGAWTGILAARGVPITPLLPANCGFLADWTEIFRERFQGHPLKNAAFRFGNDAVRGEAMITALGIEGGAIYALSARLRDEILAHGHVTVELDLRPDLSPADLAGRLEAPRRGASATNFLRKAAGLTPVAIGLLREAAGPALPESARPLAALIKATPIRLTGIAPLDRAISSAGGVAWSGVDERLMLQAVPGVFVAGEMLDWEAPTGGYLLQATFATGVAAARGVIQWLSPGRFRTG